MQPTHCEMSMVPGLTSQKHSEQYENTA